MKKKILAAVFVLALTASLIGCGKKTEPNSSNDISMDQSGTVTDEVDGSGENEELAVPEKNDGKSGIYNDLMDAVVDATEAAVEEKKAQEEAENNTESDAEQDLDDDSVAGELPDGTEEIAGDLADNPSETEIVLATADDYATAEDLIIDGETINVRRLPSTDSKVVVQLENGATVKGISKNDGWWKIIYSNSSTGNDEICYVKADFVKKKLS